MYRLGSIQKRRYFKAPLLKGYTCDERATAQGLVKVYFSPNVTAHSSNKLSLNYDRQLSDGAKFQWGDFDASLEMWLLLPPLKQQWRYIWKRTVEKSPALSKCDFCCPRWKSVGWKGLIQFPLKGWLAFPNNAHFRYWTQKHIFADMTNIVISHPNSKLSFFINPRYTLITIIPIIKSY